MEKRVSGIGIEATRTMEKQFRKGSNSADIALERAAAYVLMCNLSGTVVVELEKH
jgi:hypothetical protein